MALNSANVRVAVTGALSVAPVGTTAPADSVAALNAAFKDLGYVSDDGVTETRGRSTNTIRGWQNADVVREVVTESDFKLQATLIETKKETVELFYGSTVSGVDGSVLVKPSVTGGRKAFVLDVVDGTELIRIYIPQGEVTEVGDTVYASGEPIGFEVTITGYPDATLLGTAKKWYSGLDTTP